MHETSLEAVQRLIKEGRTTEEIRAALQRAHPQPQPQTLPGPAAGTLAAPTPTPAAGPVSAPAPPAATAPATPSQAGYHVGAASAPPALLSVGRHLSLPRLGWTLIALVCLAPAAVLLVNTPLAERFGSLSQALLALGDITGLIGLAAYVLNLVLATRFHILEDLFGGLNRVFVAHQVLGGLALMAILIHPVLTAASYYQYGLRVVAHFFIPQLEYIGTAFGIIALVLMVGLLVISFYIKIGYKLWLKTHKYLGLAYALIGLHVLLTPNKITGDLFIRWYLYVLLAVGAWAFLYRTLLPNIFVRRYLYTISRAEPKGVGVVEVTLTPVDHQIRFRAGQFIFLSFQSDGLSDEWHPFSISSAETAGSLMVDIKSLGAYTETLTRLLPHMVGMTVRVEGAYGRFSYRNFANPNQIWIAGGIGVTPFLSMAQTLGPSPYNIDLYYSVKTASELIDLETLARHQSTDPGRVFRTFPFITDTYKTFLSAGILAKNSGDLSHHDFLLCGPPPMMQAIKKQLLGLGVRERQIHSEEFSLE